MWSNDKEHDDIIKQRATAHLLKEIIQEMGPECRKKLDKKMTKFSNMIFKTVRKGDRK